MADHLADRPLIAESSTSESTNVETVLDDLDNEILSIPDYQRDSDQWDDEAKSLLVESVINNLSIPAFFFEVVIENGIEKNEVIDGQQRLTTLRDFFKNKFRMVSSDDAPYISPNSVAYAGRTFDELSEPYKRSFKRYRLTVIKLRDLKDMRLEIFRRINQGGTPLSPHDIRLAYWGSGSKTISFIRVVGIIDPEKWSAKKFINIARDQFQIEFPWTQNSPAFQAWSRWWKDKGKSRGQTPSEMFLRALVAAQYNNINPIIHNKPSLDVFNVRYHRSIEEVFDVYCACVSYQDKDPNFDKALFSIEDTKIFFDYFSHWIDSILNSKAPNMPLNVYGKLANTIGISYLAGLDLNSLSVEQWDEIDLFIRRPAEVAQHMAIDWPQSKGRWDGEKGYFTQLSAGYKIIRRIISNELPHS